MSSNINQDDVENRRIKDELNIEDSNSLLNKNTDLMSNNTLSFSISNNNNINTRKDKVEDVKRPEDFDYFFDNILTIKIPFTQIKYEVTYCQTSKTIFGGVMLFFIGYVYYMLYQVFQESNKKK